MPTTPSPDLFSLREAAVLSRLPESRVRREIERKHIKATVIERTGDAPRLLFDEPRLLYFAMLHWAGETIKLEPRTREIARDLLMSADPVRVLEESPKSLTKNRRGSKVVGGDGRNTIAEAWTRIHLDRLARARWVERIDREWARQVSRVITFNWDAVIEDLGLRIEIYRGGRARIRSDPDILGGEPVFAGTRLAVRHIGGMHLAGEPAERIIEDYPYLAPEDVAFAALYAAANPPLGRPKATAIRAA